MDYSIHETSIVTPHFKHNSTTPLYKAYSCLYVCGQWGMLEYNCVGQIRV